MAEISNQESPFKVLSFSFFDDIKYKDESPKEIKEDIQNLINKIECILQSRFSHSEKRLIRQYSDRFSFACPYCGDSAKNPRKKRGNVFYDTMAFHCYNCGKHLPVYKFLEDNSLLCDVSPEELIKYKLMHKIQVTSDVGIDSISGELVEKYSLKKNFIKKRFGFIDIENTKGFEYLKNREQYLFDNFLYSPEEDAVIILNSDYNDNVIGFQKRTLNKKAAQRYYSYNLNQIYKELKMYQHDEMKNLNMLSLIFGILKINFNEIITVFEGPLDALLYTNSIALGTASRKLPFVIDNIRYWFDYDKTGQQKALQEIKNDNSVFLWKKFFKDCSIDWSKYSKMDLNQLIIYKKRFNWQIKNFNLYFSTDKNEALYYL